MQQISSTFSAVQLRVVFTSRVMLTAEGKDQLTTFNKNMVIYQFKCYFDDSYIGLTTRQLKKMIKEYTCLH